MTTDRDVGRLLDLWLADGFDEVNDRVLDLVEDRIGRQRQRPGWRVPWRDTPMNGSFKLAAALAATVLIAITAWQLLPGRGGIGNQPTPAPTASPAPPSPSPLAAALSGTWVSAASTCADQNAALQRAGFTAAQLELAGWDAATCIGMTHGRVHEIRFLSGAPGRPAGTDGRLVELADGDVGWDGYYRVVDADTFVAGDGGRAPYITYEFRIDGDELVIDMVSDVLPGVSEAELWGDIVAQTVIYEHGPFTRQP